ncbi:DUF1660 family phage protein [Novosphingobium resinovorum]|uniref:DUF1660 family phage protein n=1 Tax=Novosphingobium resinovorum TaxID=158500 RepID=UPI003AF3D372
MSRLCKLFGHQSDWKHTYAKDGQWIGICERCSMPLVCEISENEWKPAGSSPDSSSDRSPGISGL